MPPSLDRPRRLYHALNAPLETRGECDGGPNPLFRPGELRIDVAPDDSWSVQVSLIYLGIALTYYYAVPRSDFPLPSPKHTRLGKLWP